MKMDFRKEWDWENPAEHTMTQPESEKDRKIWLLVIAIACFMLSFFVMYYIEKKLYGNVIQMNSVGYAVALFAGWLGFLWKKESEERSIKSKLKKPSKIRTWIGRLLLAALLGLVVWYCWKKREFRVIGAQMLCLLPLGIAIDKAKKWEGTDEKELELWSMLFSFALLALVTFFVPKMMGVCSVPQAQAELTEKGYAEVSYVRKMEAHWLYTCLETPPLLTEEERKNLEIYLFRAEKDGEDWGIVIDPWNGRILDEEQAAMGTNLRDWLGE